MKKIAILGPNLENRGGVNVVINHLKNYFEKNKIEVHLFPVGKTEVNESEFIHPINSNKKNEQLKLFKDKFKYYKNYFNLIISNNLRTNWIVSELDIKNSLYVLHQGRIIQKEYNLYSFLKRKLKFKKIYNNKNIVFLNECYEKLFLKKYNIVPNKSIIIPNPFSFEQIIAKSAEKKFIDNDYIIVVGRIENNKNVNEVIKAYKKGNFKEELWLLGDGKHKNDTYHLVKKLNLQKKVKFLGWKENPYPYIKNAKLLVSASKFESFGNILVEALILNTPAVSSDIKCGPSEILVGELSGFLYKLGNIEELTEKMKKALNDYPEIREEYIKKYKVENIAKKYLEFLS